MNYVLSPVGLLHVGDKVIAASFIPGVKCELIERVIDHVYIDNSTVTYTFADGSSALTMTLPDKLRVHISHCEVEL